ncbi:hypothetical protein [Burkholderia ambifaria]|uniref:hypothetical protein n=1 Tax=Burkholderia ambifaria TaxID=152480 RepID=UPI000F800934|nr:hypothetical protein [Burkholderia ambifaria]
MADNEDFDPLDFQPRADYVRPDDDEMWAEAHRIADAETDEERWEAEAAAREMGFLPAPEVLGEGKKAAVIVDDPVAFEQLKQAVSAQTPDAAHDPAATQAAPEATTQAPAQETVAAPAADAAKAPGAADAANPSGQPAKVERPTSLEQSLSAIQLNTERQQRFVIVGDPNIERRFYDHLAERGKLTYLGGVPVIGLNREQAMKVLREVAAEMPGASAQHALSMQVDRAGHGVLGKLVAGVKDTLGYRHEVDVMVVGNPDTVQAKLKEMGETLGKMHGEGFFKNGELPRDGDGRLHIQDGAVTLEGAVKLDRMLSLAKDATAAWQRQEDERRNGRTERQDGKPDANKAADKAADQPAAGTAAAAAPAEPPNKHAQKLAGEVASALANPSQLHDKNDKGQELGVSLIRRATVFKDPAEKELGTLPAEQRQQMLVQLAALATKLDAKEFGEAGAKALNAGGRNGEPSPREKLAAWLTQEATSDATFEAKAKALTQALVQQGALTAEQADRLHATLARDVSPATSRDAAQASGDAPKAEATAAAGKTPATEAPAAPSENTTHAAPAVATEAVAHATTVAPTEAAPATVSAPAEVAAPGETKAPVEAPASGAAEPLVVSAPARSLYDHLDDALKDGPGATTAEQARRVIDALDARREDPLSSLESGSAQDPSTTLRRIRVLLVNAEFGQFGDELAAKAESLRGAVQEWTRQDTERLDKQRESGASTEARPAPAQAMAKEAEPNAAVKAARMQAGSGADAEQQSSRSSGRESVAEQRAEHAARTQAPARETVREAEQVHVHEQTRAHAATLYKLMANPAGSFTKRDKSWNQANLAKAAQAVAGLDLKETAKLPPAERTTLAAYSAWLADAANAGKLPGFGSESGRALAAQVTEKSSGLIQQADGALPASTNKELAKAERMVSAMLERESTLSKAASTSLEAGGARGIGGAHSAKGLAQDLVHAVYRQSEMDEGYANYLLKNAGQFTPEALRGLDAETKARTVVALQFLAGEVRNGAMGDFDQLSDGVRRNVLQAQKVADALHDSMRTEPGMTTTLTRAYLELNSRGQESHGGKPERDTDRSAEVQPTGRSEASAGRRGAAQEFDR